MQRMYLLIWQVRAGKTVISYIAIRLTMYMYCSKMRKNERRFYYGNDYTNTD